MDKRAFRISLISGLIGLVAIFFVIAVASSDTKQTKANASNVEKVSPAPGGMARPQSEVSFDLQDGFVGRLVIDGEIIPDDQIEKVVSLGQFTFRPGPGKAIVSFTAGQHGAQIFYWPADENESQSSQTYQWSFKVTS